MYRIDRYDQMPVLRKELPQKKRSALYKKMVLCHVQH